MKLKNIIIFLFLFILLFSTTIFASSEDYSVYYDKLNHYFDMNYNDYHYFSYFLNGRFYYVWINNIDLDTDIYIVLDDNNKLIVYNSDTNEQMSYVMKAKEYLNTNFEGYEGDNINSIYTDFTLFDFSVNNELVDSNIDFYDSNGEVFFHPPVTEQGVVIPALETAEQIPQAIVTTLKILIPVGLVLLSIGLVIYLIKRVRYSTM